MTSWPARTTRPDGRAWPEGGSGGPRPGDPSRGLAPADAHGGHAALTSALSSFAPVGVAVYIDNFYGAACAALVTGAIGATVAVAPQLWLGWFTTDPEAYTFGAIYLAIAAPSSGFFGGGQTLYFASQGTGRMILPVFVGVVRFAIVAAGGSLAVAMSWGITVVFAAVSAGLITIGVGLALCLFTSAWRPSPSPVATSP